MFRVGRALASLVVVAGLLTACTGVTVGPGASSVATPRPVDVAPDDTPNNGPAAGRWTGTITFTGSVSSSKDEPGHSDLDPNNTYYETWTDSEAIQEDATDTLTIDAADDDLTYGIRSVELAGTAANSGNTNQRSVRLTNKQNSGCTWKEEDGNETTGSWSSSGDAQGGLYFEDDGSYELNVSASPNDYADLQGHSWLKYSDISANCEPNNPEYDDPMPSAPLVEWVSDHQNDPTVGDVSTLLEGQVSPSNPGTVVDGSKSWELKYPEGYKITVTWHLEHSDPIVLPHD